MPRLDGFGFWERLRSNAEIRAILVIVLTAYDCEENRSRSLELGAVQFVPKPFSLRELATRVEEYLA